MFNDNPKYWVLLYFDMIHEELPSSIVIGWMNILLSSIQSLLVNSSRRGWESWIDPTMSVFVDH